METARHYILDKAVQVYRRVGSPHWQCSASFGGKQLRATTKEESLAQAKDVARDWYLSKLGKYRGGELKTGPTFNKAADQFVKEYGVITQGERNPNYVESHSMLLRVHLRPFFGDTPLSEITPGMVQDYRIHRMTSRKDPKTQTPIIDPTTNKPMKDPITKRSSRTRTVVNGSGRRDPASTTKSLPCGMS